jgi:hypothetical protein
MTLARSLRGASRAISDWTRRSRDTEGSAASPQKRALITQRYQDLWGRLDEHGRGQLHPSEPTEPPPPGEKKEAPADGRPPRTDLPHIDLMSGPEFERFIGKAFEEKGYEVQYHGGPTEAGGDLVCWERSVERVHAILVQVKRERCLTGTKAVGQIMRKENLFRRHYPETSYEKWIITSSCFSRQAIREAESGGIILIDRDALQNWLTGR